MLLTGLRRIAEMHDGDFRLTANQNVIIANVRPENRAAIEALVAEHGLTARRRPCGATRWPASRCRPAAWPWPRASAICRPGDGA